MNKTNIFGIQLLQSQDLLIMKKTVAFLYLNFLFSSICFSQMHRGEIDSALLPKISLAHYIPEYTFDVPVDSNAWTEEKPEMHVAFGSEDELYFRTEVPKIKEERTLWKATGWKGERLNTQVVVWSTETLQHVGVKVSDLKNEKGTI